MWARRGEEGVPSWLAATWAFSVLNLCCRVQEAEVCLLFSFPKNRPLVSALPHGIPCKARSHPSLTATSSFPCCPSLPHPPTRPRAARLQMARACRGAGLVPEGREQCGPWAITPGLQHGLPVLTVQDRYPGSHVPVRCPRPFHDTIFSHITEPTSFILSCACNFPHRHASSSQMPH